jgi:hypothetical protein
MNSIPKKRAPFQTPTAAGRAGRYGDADRWLAQQGAGSKAHHRLRDLPSFRFRAGLRPPRRFHPFYDRLVRPRLALAARSKAKRAALERTAERAVFALVLAGPGRAVADTRDCRRPGVRARVAAWDAVEAAGLCVRCLGSESSGKVTRYAATPTLLDLHDEWAMPVLPPERPPPVSDLIRLHTGTRDLTTGRRLPVNERRRRLPLFGPGHVRGTLDAMFEYYAGRLDRINRESLNHTWKALVRDSGGTLRAVQPSVCLHLTYSGRLFHGGRLYTEGPWSAQGLPKSVRRGLLIDNRPVAELDFVAMALRMVYNLAQLDPDDDDLYRPGTILPAFYAAGPPPAQAEAVRRLVKQATILSLNARSREGAHSSVAHWVARHPHGRFLWRVLRAEGLDVPGLVARIVAAHADIRHRFFTECSADLQARDGQVMLDTLTRFAAAGKPALPLHDGILCKARDAAFAQRVMVECYRANAYGFAPVVKRVY